MKIDFINPKNTTDHVNTNNTTPATQEAVRALGGRVHASRVGARSTNPSRITPFNRVITSSRKLYARQLEQNASVKNRCLEYNVTKYYDEPDSFWAEFESRKDTILDRSSFNARCTKEGLNPENVAEHLIFEGSAAVKKTLETGFEHLKGKQKNYSEPIRAKKLHIEKVGRPKMEAVTHELPITRHTENLADIPRAVVVKTA